MIEEPDEPVKDGYVFTGWLDEEGNVFDFDSYVYENKIFTADWEEVESVTEEELEDLKNAEIIGIAEISFDDSPIISAEVTCSFDDEIGYIEITKVTDGAIMNTAGLVGYPIEITTEAEIKEVQSWYEEAKKRSQNEALKISYPSRLAVNSKFVTVGAMA